MQLLAVRSALTARGARLSPGTPRKSPTRSVWFHHASSHISPPPRPPQFLAVARRQPEALLLPSDATRTRLRDLTALLNLGGQGQAGGGGASAVGRVVLGSPRLLVQPVELSRRHLAGLQEVLQVGRGTAVGSAGCVPALHPCSGTAAESGGFGRRPWVWLGILMMLV
jgi:hypothetical protein